MVRQRQFTEVKLEMPCPSEMPAQSEKQVVPIKDALNYHATLEKHHRSLHDKLRYSKVRAARKQAREHRAKWHHHARMRTQIEGHEREGHTSVKMSLDLTRRERYMLRTQGLGWRGALRGAAAGATAGGITGAGYGAGVGGTVGIVSGGAGLLPGVAGGAAVGGAAGGVLGGVMGAIGGHMKEREDNKRGEAHGKEVADLVSKGHKVTETRNTGTTHTTNLTGPNGEKHHLVTAKDPRLGGYTHVSNHGHVQWDESKHPREHGQFTAASQDGMTRRELYQMRTRGLAGVSPGDYAARVAAMGLHPETPWGLHGVKNATGAGAGQAAEHARAAAETVRAGARHAIRVTVKVAKSAVEGVKQAAKKAGVAVSSAPSHKTVLGAGLVLLTLYGAAEGVMALKKYLVKKYPLERTTEEDHEAYGAAQELTRRELYHLRRLGLSSATHGAKVVDLS